ncbi:MAG: hypothetical protein JW793_09755 [Acidobacteria bacterium]|nr:hypothetical protein [Acidobacteriota bacterium]
MAGILEKIGGGARIRNARTELLLQFLRFRKFLENMKEMIRIIEDGKDKLGEEYIFDRHYVLSLVDGVLENAAMMAFDASVLAPAAGRNVYRRLDAQRKFAREEFLQSPGIMRMEHFPLSAAHKDKDPETLLLSAVVNWFTGPLERGSPSVMDFIRTAADAVIGNCGKDEPVENAGSYSGKVKLSGGGLLQTFDINGIAPAGGKGFVSPGDIPCRPFGLMRLGSVENPVSAGISATESGIERRMIFDRESISLGLRCNEGKIHLEATLSGDVASDYIFLYFRKPFDSRHELSRGFQVEETGEGILAWYRDVPTDDLEKQLVRLGSILLR